MTVRVAGRLFKKSIVRNMQGQILTWLDEAEGGYIIRNGQIVNQEKYNEYLQKEADRKEAAKAIIHQRVDDNIDRTITPSKADELEKRINAQDEKLDAILAALSKK